MFANKGMRWLILVCVFLAGVCVYPLVVWGLYAATTVTDVGRQMYIGRTTVMEVMSQPGDRKSSLGELGNLATSQTVLSNAAQTLSELGMNPSEVLPGTTVTPVKDTNILSIEVTSTDAKQAKVAADTLGAELKKAYSELHAGESTGIVKTIDPAFVRPAPHANAAASMLTFITNPLAGPAIGVAVGLALGLLLGALFRNRRQPASTQPGV